MLIGLNGFKGSGKDTVGSYLVDKYGFEQASFAAKLKESAAALFDIDPAKWETWKNDETMRVMVYRSEKFQPWAVNDMDFYVNTITVRQFLQRYGTEAHRDVFGTDFWVDHALSGIDRSKNYVFTDARFENELQRIKSFGGYNVKILRPDIINKDSHASESEPPNHLIDYQIINGSDFEALYNQVDQFMEWLQVIA